MLEELSKHHDKWRSIAFKICNNNTLADDLTQDMYIKLHETNKTFEEINEWYVWVTIKNLYLNHIKKREKEISIELFYNIEDVVDDKQLLKRRVEIHDALNKLDLWDREILIHTSEKSLRKLSQETNISVNTLFHSKKNALEKLKQKL